MAQLVEQSLATPEVCHSNSVIGKIYIEQCLLSTVLKRQNKEKRGRERSIKKTNYIKNNNNKYNNINNNNS